MESNHFENTNKAQESAEELFRRGCVLFDQKNYDAAIPLILEAANMGYAEAQNHMGVNYRLGEGVPKDPQKGIEWYRKAVAQNHAKAQLNLALIYLKGIDLPQDLNEAFRLTSLAAEQGFANAQTKLAEFYECGKVVQQDYATAAMWYQKAADQGYAVAMCELGYLYSQGNGVPQDLLQAKVLWEEAIARGSKKAQKHLNTMNKLLKVAVKQFIKENKELDFSECSEEELMNMILYIGANPDALDAPQG